MSRATDAIDSPLGAASRFIVELTAWIAAPWAAARISPLLAALVLVTLVALPSVFNARGDKQHRAIPVPGHVRILLELLMMGAALTGMIAILPAWADAVPVVVVTLALTAGWPRWRWLATGDTPPHQAPGNVRTRRDAHSCCAAVDR